MNRRPRSAVISVVICDDHPSVARGIAMLLENETTDFKVLGVVGTGEEAEEIVDETRPDVVLMDIYLPGRTGIETTRRIRSKHPATAVVMFTASDAEDDLYDALKAGAVGYVTKEQDVSEIADTIRNVGNGNCVFPSQLVGRLIEDLGKSRISLNDEEEKILSGLAVGETHKSIASKASLSERTIRRRIETIYSKLHLAGRNEAAVYARDRRPSAHPETRNRPIKGR